MKDFIFDKSNKKVKFNVYLNFITAFLVFIFYVIPVFPIIEGEPFGFIVFFILLFTLFSKGLHLVHYQVLYAIFLVGFVGYILLLNYSIKFQQGRKIIKAKKYITYLFMQIPFSLGLLFFGIYIFINGTHEVVDGPIQPIATHYPYNMILAILIIFINVFQIIHFYILKLRSNNKFEKGI